MLTALASASGHDAVVAIPDRTPTLRSERTLLRPFQRSDVQGRVRCGKDPEIIRMFGGSPDFEEPVGMPLDEANAWYEVVLQPTGRGDRTVEDSGRAAGRRSPGPRHPLGHYPRPKTRDLHVDAGDGVRGHRDASAMSVPIAGQVAR